MQRLFIVASMTSPSMFLYCCICELIALCVFFELCTVDYYRYYALKITFLGPSFTVPGGLISISHTRHAQATDHQLLCAGMLNAVQVFLQLLLQNSFCSRNCMMAEGRDVNSDDGEFKGSSCIQLGIYAHVLLYFIP